MQNVWRVAALTLWLIVTGCMSGTGYWIGYQHGHDDAWAGTKHVWNEAWKHAYRAGMAEARKQQEASNEQEEMP